MKILVTGSAGFIGSNIVNKLVTIPQYEVFGVDNFSTGKEINVNSKCQTLTADITDRKQANRAFHVSEPDIVIHLAANGSIINSVNDPALDANVNIIGTLNIIEMCKLYGVKKLIFASSMQVYGSQPPPFNNISTPCLPQTNYGVSKYAAERYVVATGQDTNNSLTTEAIRMYNVYGPNQDLTNPYQGVLAIFIGKALKGEDIVVFGDGGQKRDFTYIDDVVEVYVKSVGSFASGASSGIIDVGTGRSTSINEISELLKDHFPKITVRKEAKRFQEQSDSYCDEKSFGVWLAKTSLNEGLKETIKWARRASK